MRSKNIRVFTLLTCSLAVVFLLFLSVFSFNVLDRSQSTQRNLLVSISRYSKKPPVINYSMVEWNSGQGSGADKDAYPAKKADEWTDLLKNRTEGWSGADGIFTANLDGTINEGIENRPNQQTVFVFSDTLVGKVDREANTRSDVKMYNHSFAVLDGNEPRSDRIEFFHENDSKTPKLPIKPSKDGQWYWLSECFVLPDDEGTVMNAFLLRMERQGNGAFGFRHLGVDLLRIRIRNGKLDFDSALVTEDKTGRLHHVVIEKQGDTSNENLSKATIIFGTGVLENLKSTGVAKPDGYVYVYGYRDDPPWSRRLVVARVLPKDIARLDRWKYFSGDNQWSDKIQDSVTVADSVSTEISVTPIPPGPQAGKYALVYTPGTIGSKIALRIGDSPVGPFGEERIIFEEMETATYGKGVFAYNAKAHPVISKNGELIISYNVNSNDDSFRIFREPDIYCPRFVRIKLSDL